MASYDSDSSGGEEQDYTETEVLLGYASKDSKGEAISRLGGRPEWLSLSSSPSSSLARCKACRGLMVLLLQLNGELPDRFPNHERRLYVLFCRNKACRRKDGSTRVLRGVRSFLEEAPAAKHEPQKKESAPRESSKSIMADKGVGEALFGVKPMGPPTSTARANPFSSSTSINRNPFSSGTSSSHQNPPAIPPESAPVQEPKSSADSGTSKDDSTSSLPKTFAQTLSLNNSQQVHEQPAPPEPWPPESDQPAPYPISWLADAEYETLDPIPLPSATPSTTAMDVDSAETGAGSGKEDKDVFESAMDAAFQKFADRVGQNPDQCIRYEFGGQPLLYSKTDAVGKLLAAHGGENKVATASGMPRCANCGAKRVFEVQLTPHAIEVLEEEEDGLEGMDWGTVIVGTCERDCLSRDQKVGEDVYLEEWVGVQWEELMAKR